MLGRNDPCHCGSGKKFKRCCYLIQAANTAESVTAECPVNSDNAIEALHSALKGRDVNNIDEAQQFVQSFVAKRNSKPLFEFNGLSSNQVDDLLERPFESPHILQFDIKHLAKSSELAYVPIVYLAVKLAKALGDKGVKATAKGNLPRNLCQEIAKGYYQKIKVPLWQRKITKEDDFYDLNMVRHVMSLAGLLRKFKGKFVLTKLMKSYLAPILSADTLGNDDMADLTMHQQKQETMAVLFFSLFKNYVGQFNWAYGSYDEKFSFIQQSFAYSLYLVSLKGKELLLTEQYSEDYIKAFPAILKYADHRDQHFSPEQQVSACYNHWFFEQFASYFGFIELTNTKTDDSRKYKSIFSAKQVATTPLFDAFIRFN